MDTGKVIVVTDQVQGTDDLDKNSGLTVKRTVLSCKSWSILSFSGLRFYFSMILFVLNLVKQNEIESVHCGRTLHEGVVGLVIKFLTGTPFLCYVHGEDIEMCRSSREFTFIVNQVLKYSSIVICNSYNSAELLKKWKGNDDSKVRVLHPGVDASSFLPSNAIEKTTDKKQKVILTVSRLQARKGHDVLIRAMPKIVKRHPDAHYFIVGSGKQQDYLSSLIQELKLEKHVTLTGECTEREMKDWYQLSDLFVLPNRQIGNDVEGFGIVLLEAQASETAVIAGDSGGTRETMNIGQTGYILDCRAPEQLVDRINELFDNPELLRSMGKKGREWILSTFDWPVIISSAQQIFKEVSAKSGR